MIINNISKKVIYTGLLMSGWCMNGCNDLQKNAPEKQETFMGGLFKKEIESEVEGFKVDIEKATLDNNNFRKVLYTSGHHQLVLMNLKPNEEIGEEIHPETDQFFRFEQGKGKCIINNTTYHVKDGDAIMIPAGSRHNVINTEPSESLKVYTIYSPPHHKDGIVRKTKEDAQAREEKFDGITTEAN